LLPKLLKDKQAGEVLRVWIPACSTGEEAYSLAMLLREIQDTKYAGIPIQVFATDLSASAVSKARIGIYTKGEVENVSPKRLQRFFTKSNGNFRIAQSVRDVCVFAPHNVLIDPPFSHIDFISCCNLLIYFDVAAQKKALATFHYALTKNGYLMLGKSESIGQSGQLFTSSNKKLRIYQRKRNSGLGILSAGDTRLSQRHTMQVDATNPIAIPPGGKQKIKGLAATGNDFENAIDSILLSRFSPASVVINQRMEILQFRGETNLYLAHAPGIATLDILKMARPEISFELRNAIARAFKTKKPVDKRNIEMNGGRNIVSLEVLPLNNEFIEPLLLIVFTEQQHEEIATQGKGKRSKMATAAKDRRIKKMEEEMSAYRQELRNITHDHEAAIEELQSSNEEVVSSNEELRSMNEELETSKEEIQSANEELATSNQELRTRNELINELYNYSESIIATIHDPMIILDKELRVKTANSSFYKKFRVSEERTEGVLLYELGNGQWNIPRLRMLLENIIPKNSAFHDFEVDHNFPGIGQKVMLLNAKRIIQHAHREELILLAIADITELRRLTLELQQKEKKELEEQIEVEKKIIDAYKIADAYIRNVFMQASVSIVVYKGPSFIVDMINDKGLEMWGTTYEEVINKPLFEISPELREQHLEKILTDVYTKGEPFIGDEIPLQYIRNGKHDEGYFNFAIHPVHDFKGTIIGVTAVGTEVTQEVTARKKIEESEKRFRDLIQGSPVGIYTCNVEGDIELYNETAFRLWGRKPETGKDKWCGSWKMYDSDGTFLPHDKCPMAVAIKEGRTVRSEIIIEQPDGTRHSVIPHPQPLYDLNGRLIGAINTVIDITPQVIAMKRMEASEKSLAKLAAIVQHSEDAIISKTLEGIITSWNPGAEKIFGYSPEEMIGQSIMKVLPRDRLVEESGILERIRKGEGVKHFETQRLAKDGKLIDISLTISSIKDGKGNITGASIIARDISRAKKIETALRESEKQFRELADAMPQIVWTARPDGYIDYYNRQWYEFTGFGERYGDESWVPILHPEDVQRCIDRYHHSIKTGEPFQIEYRFKDRKNPDTYRWFIGRANAIRDEHGKIAKWFGTCTDIDDAKRVQEELEQGKQRREDFIKMASHELKTPITTIKGYIQLVLSGVRNEEQVPPLLVKSSLLTMEKQVNRLTRLMSELLDLSRIEAGQLELNKESFNLNELVMEIAQEVLYTNNRYAINISHDFECSVYADRDRMGQVITNILNNAIKYSPGAETIDVRIQQQGQTEAAVIVKDYGIGIDKVNQGKIFERFYRAEGKSEQTYPGFGVGLYLASEIVQRHNGRISVESEKTKGSSFTVTLPLADCDKK
jgi:PAS domain S-box-containing protein